MEKIESTETEKTQDTTANLISETKPEPTVQKRDFGNPGKFMKMPTQDRIYSGNLRLKKFLEDPAQYLNTVETVGGWARKVRKQKFTEIVNEVEVKKELLFIDLNDGTCQKNLQVVVDDGIGEVYEELKKGNRDTCYLFTGTIEKSLGEGQFAEMKVNNPSIHKAQVVGHNSNPGKYSLIGKNVNLDTIRKTLHLRPRHNLIAASMRIRNSVSFATHLFFQAMGFFYIHTPIITCSDCEGAGEMFGVTTLLKADQNITELPQKKKKKNVLDYGSDFFC